MNKLPIQRQEKAKKRKKLDARKLGEDAIFNLRSRVIQLHLEKLSNRQICERTGLSNTFIRKILALYRQGGHAALALKTRGRKFGHRRLLASEQELRLLHVISNHLPREQGLNFELWERAAIIELIQKEFRFRMCDRTAQLYVSRWGFTRLPLIGGTILDDQINLPALNLGLTEPPRSNRFQVRDWSLNTSELASTTLNIGVEKKYASLLEAHTLLMLVDRRRSAKWICLKRKQRKLAAESAPTKLGSAIQSGHGRVNANQLTLA